MVDNVNRKDVFGPCPIPRCALEWFLAITSIAVGAGFILLPLGLQMQEWLLSLSEPLRTYIQPGWGALIVFGGALQAISLVVPRIPQHLAALLAGLLWLVVAVMVIQAGLLLLIIPSFALMIGELWVSTMLKP